MPSSRINLWLDPQKNATKGFLMKFSTSWHAK